MPLGLVDAACSTDQQEAQIKKSGCLWKLQASRGVRAWTCLRRFRAEVLRISVPYQHAVLVKTSEDFTVFWLTELKQPELLSESPGILCCLATANKRLPSVIVRTRIAEVWSRHLLALAREPGLKTCSPEDFERAMIRLNQMPRGDAAQLVEARSSLNQKSNMEEPAPLKPTATASRKLRHSAASSALRRPPTGALGGPTGGPAAEARRSRARSAADSSLFIDLGV